MLFTLPWKSCLILIQLIMQYYRFFFPYRLRPLAIEPVNKKNESTLVVVCHRSTSTSSLTLLPSITRSVNHRSVATQTHHPQSSIEGPNPPEIYLSQSPKRRRFLFQRSMITSPSLFTNFFRHSSETPGRTSESSTKSSLSWGQRSSTASSSNPTRLSHQQTHHPSTRYSSGIFRRIESEMDTLLAHERRSHGSTSSSSLLQTTYRHRTPSSTQRQRPFKRYHFHSRSAHVLHQSSPTRTQQKPQQINLGSVTNTTTSSDSPSILHRYPRFFPTVIHHRNRDEDIVASNERKALRVLMIIFCVFITLWTPFFICTFLSAVCDRCRENIPSTAWFSITWLGYASSMANPFIYTIFSDVFRRAFANIILCRENDAAMSGQMSTKFSQYKGLNHGQFHQAISSRRSPVPEQSRTSTPIPLHHPTPISGSDATIYVNRCASGAFR